VFREVFKMRTLHEPLPSIPEPDTTSLGAFFVSFFSNPHSKEQGKLLEAYKEALNKTKSVLREAADEIRHSTKYLLDLEDEEYNSDAVEYDQEVQQGPLQCHQEMRSWAEEASVTYEDLLQSLGGSKVPSTAAPSTTDPGSKIHSRTASLLSMAAADLVDASELCAALPTDADIPLQDEYTDTESEWDRCDDGTEVEAEAEAEMGAGACDTAAKEEQEQDDWEFIPSNILSQPESGVLNAAHTTDPAPPVLSQPSRLLNPPMQIAIGAALPAALASRHWQLLYTSHRQQSSLREISHATSRQPTGANLVVIQDTRGAVFGGFHSASLGCHSSEHLSGKPCSFVFTAKANGTCVFLANDVEESVVHPMKDFLAFGLQPAQHAFWIDSELRHGTSRPCSAFGSYCLANSQNFSIREVEVWGFAEEE